MMWMNELGMVLLGGLLVGCGSGQSAGHGSAGGGSGSGGGSGGSGQTVGSGGAEGPRPSEAGTEGGTGAGVEALPFLQDLEGVVPSGVGTDANGNIYVIGMPIAPQIDLGSSSVELSSGRYAIAVVWSLDPAGNVRWATPIELDAVSSNWAPGWPSLGVAPNGDTYFVVPSPSSHEAFVGKVVDGNQEFLRTITADLHASALASDGAAAYVMTHYGDATDFGCGDPLADGGPYTTGILLVQISTKDGTCITQDTIPGADAPILHLSPDGLFVAAKVANRVTFAGNTFELTNGGALLASLSGVGAARWVHVYDVDSIWGIAVSEEALVMSGQSWTTSTELGLPANVEAAGFLALFGTDGTLKKAFHSEGGLQRLAGFRDGAAYGAYQAVEGASTIAGHLVRLDTALELSDDHRITMNDNVQLLGLAVGKDEAGILVGSFYGDLEVEGLAIHNSPFSDPWSQTHGFVLSLPR